MYILQACVGVIDDHGDFLMKIVEKLEELKDKKSTRLNSNVSSQSNRSTVLQAKLLPCYDSGKPD